MNMKSEIDNWTHEAFEDSIARAMVALYETKLDKHCSKTSRLARFTMEDLVRIRRHGVFVPAPDRILLAEGDMMSVDDQIQALPPSGCFSMGESRDPSDPDHMETYCGIYYFRRVAKLPRKAMSFVPGHAYEVLRYYPQDQASAMGTRSYVTANPTTRRITRCLELGSRPISQMMKHSSVDPDRDKDAILLNFGMQYIDDMRHQWRITAMNEDTRVVVGAYAENVKSLLFARSLPMTPTGRKRPILHVVSAHRRRLKEGTDIDISMFLRGTREIEMNGTLFKVDAPQRLIDEHSLKQ
jgi:hypothetical protein